MKSSLLKIRNYKKEILLCFVLFCIALFVRLFQISEITPGVYPDELTIAQASQEILSSSVLVPYVSVNYGHPTPLLYLEGVSMQIFGNTILAMRLPSILFGSLVVIAFYLALRAFFPVTFSFLGALIMVFHYASVVLSRLSYETQASLFFQLVTLLFLYYFYKSEKKVYLIGTGFVIGAGLYTYLNFRVFAIFICSLMIILIVKKRDKKYIQNVLLFIASVFIVALPLLVYAIQEPSVFSSRVAAISIFSQGYSPIEFMKELGTNIYRTLLLPFFGIPGMHPPFSGDPNPGKNPAGVPLFDPIISLLAVFGLVCMFREKRKLLCIILALLLPSIVSDIFSIEIIPQVHYYGLGHPNTLRVSGSIGIVIFAAVYGLFTISQKLKSRYRNYAAITAVILISAVNLFLYFGQQYINRTFYLYNYKVNHADEIELIQYLNSGNKHTVSMTNSYSANNTYLQFFLSPKIKIKPFQFSSTAQLLSTIVSSEATAIEVSNETVSALNQIIPSGQIERYGYATHEIKGIVEQPDFIVFEKVSL